MYRNRTSGIYRIVNKTTGKVYVGSSCHLEERMIRHQIHLNNGKHVNCYLQRAWNKYGKSDFLIEVIEKTSDLISREQYWVDFYRSGNKRYGYNIKSDIVRNSMPEETRRKISMSNLGKKMPVEFGNMVRERNSGAGNGQWNKSPAIRKISSKSIIEIDRLLMQGHSLSQIGVIYSCSSSNISCIKNRKRSHKKAISEAYNSIR